MHRRLTCLQRMHTLKAIADRNRHLVHDTSSVSGEDFQYFHEPLSNHPQKVWIKENTSGVIGQVHPGATVCSKSCNSLPLVLTPLWTPTRQTKLSGFLVDIRFLPPLFEASQTTLRGELSKTIHIYFHQRQQCTCLLLLRLCFHRQGQVRSQHSLRATDELQTDHPETNRLVRQHHT